MHKCKITLSQRYPSLILNDKDFSLILRKIGRDRNRLIASMFDLFKNILDSDKSHMQNEETLQGWIFMNHLALLAVYKIYHILQDKQLISKYSIRDFIQHLMEIRAVKINDSWHTAEIIHATGKFLEKIGLEYKPIP